MKNTGGPAFSSTKMTNFGKEQIHHAGMTLRDWFAGQALAGMLANSSVIGNQDAELIAACYRAADALLAERDK